MPYPAIWTRSQRGQLSADYESVVFPGNTFIFLHKRRTQHCSYFRCAYCAKALKYRLKRKETNLTIPIVRASLEEGFLDDPDNPFHRHFCIEEKEVDTSTYAAKARYIYNKVKLELMDMPMTPRQAWLQMEAEVIANFPDTLTQQEIICRLPNDKSAKRSFARRSSVGKRNLAEDFASFERDCEFDNEEESDTLFLLGVDLMANNKPDFLTNDSSNIPLDLLKSTLPRPPWICPPGREKLANFFLIYRECRSHSPIFMVFADMMGINLIHKCPDIVCDGNSSFYPHGFAQLYTFHAVHHSIPEEAHLCAFALLPNTASSTYIKLFDIISRKLFSEFGDHGIQKLAAINGCKTIFNDDIVEWSEQRTSSFAKLWHEHLRSLFFGIHPGLNRFIRTMREELTRSGLQAERIFRPPSLITSINLDNIEAVNKVYIKEENISYGFDYPSINYKRTKNTNTEIDNKNSTNDGNNVDDNYLNYSQHSYIIPIHQKSRKRHNESSDGN
uniref:CxC1 domain-containing protein n=1 Tax=Meloidogyne hapla TaxID=6305 RepID=A0A1I8C1C6_MELHA